MRNPVELCLAIISVVSLLSACATPASNSTPTTPPPPPPPPASAPTAPAPSGQTSDERREAIDKKLDGTLGTFDETLRKEQEAVAREQDAGNTENESNSKQNEETPSDPAIASGERPGDLKSDKTVAAEQSGGVTSGTGATAANIPDGSDDDIVARRLRKAAEEETDPELKEKLWREYLEYKKGAGK
jgi:type IV secretory pathway VirB10-like protein